MVQSVNYRHRNIQLKENSVLTLLTEIYCKQKMGLKQ